MRKITVHYNSRSTPGVKYKTERHRNGNVTCFCPGFVYNQTCWHTKQLEKMPRI